MITTRSISAGALALAATFAPSLHAQGTGPTIELAFGYECGDRFLVRNDGANPVVIEYAMAGSQDKSQLHLNGKQSAEIASAQSGNMELWVGGKLVASEPKGDRACNAARSNARSNARAAVQPAEPEESTAQPADTTYNAAPVVVYASPYDYYYPTYPYAYYGYDPFFYPTFGFYGGFYGGGYYRGGGFRGGGYRGGGGLRGGGLRGGGFRGRGRR